MVGLVGSGGLFPLRLSDSKYLKKDFFAATQAAAFRKGFFKFAGWLLCRFGQAWPAVRGLGLVGLVALVGLA